MSGAATTLARRLRKLPHSELRRRAAAQARRNRFGPVEAGGIGPRALATIAAIEGDG